MSSEHHTEITQQPLMKRTAKRAFMSEEVT